MPVSDAPITWRSVTAPNLSDALIPMQRAAAAVTDSLNPFQKLIGQVEATDQSNWNTQKSNNTQAVLDQIASTMTPEDFAAKRASGEIDRMVAGMGAQVDRAQVRNALDARPDELIKRARNSQAFEAEQLDKSALPIINQIKIHQAAGETDKANALIQANLPILRNAGALAMDSREIDRTDSKDELSTRSLNDQHASALQGQTRGNLEITNLQRDTKEANDARTLREMAATYAATQRANPAGRSDTAAFQKFQKDALEAGAPPALVEKLKTELGGMFDARAMPVGRDAARILDERAAELKKETDFKERGASAVGSPEPLRNTKPLYDFASSQARNDDEAKALNEFVGQASTKPFKVDGKMVYAPEQMILTAMGQAQDDRLYGTRWARDSNRGVNAMKVLEKMMQSDQVKQDIKTRDEVNAASIKRVAASAQYPVPNLPGALLPSDPKKK